MRALTVTGTVVIGWAACRPMPSGALAARPSTGPSPRAPIADMRDTDGAAQQVVQSPYRPWTPLGLDEYFVVPDSNLLTASKVALGRRLFVDRRLSRDSSVACASCHRPDLVFADTVAQSRGAEGRRPSRNTPSLANRAYRRSFFRDGRTVTLEQTVLKPVINPAEMDLQLDLMIGRIKGDEGYRASFARIFPDALTAENVARSLASYVRTLRSGDSRFDRFAAGDTMALTAEARGGLRLFMGRADCSRCHAGPLLSDEEFHNTGVSWGATDTGRFGVTHLDADRGRFRTASLRDVAATPPYMHDGSLTTLQDVVEFYDGGGGRNPYLDPEIRPLGLSGAEKRSLIAFLESLTGVSGQPGSQ